MSLDRRTRRLLIGCVTLSSLGAFLSMVAISMGYQAPAGEEQPKVTDWMQAWGSVGGVVAGLAAAGAAALLLMHERKRSAKAEAQLADEKADAALNAPRAVVVTPARFGTLGVDGDHITHAHVTVHNYGNQAIWNVATVVTLPEDGRQMLLRHLEVLGPGDKLKFSQHYPNGIHVPGPWVPRNGRATVTVCFIDHTNQAWQRTSDGGLARTSVPYPLIEEALHTPETIMPTT